MGKQVTEVLLSITSIGIGRARGASYWRETELKNEGIKQGGAVTGFL